MDKSERERTGRKEVPRGPTSQHVAHAVHQLRDQCRWTLEETAEAVTNAGRPIQGSGIGKIEYGKRQVNVDDLMALAVAFDVSPIRLLLPVGDSGDEVDLTESTSASFADVWQWARGGKPLGEPGQESNEVTTRSLRFHGETHPDQYPHEEHSPRIQADHMLRITSQLEDVLAQARRLRTQEATDGDR